MKQRLFFLIAFALLAFSAAAQVKLGGRSAASEPIEINFENPKTYEIGGIEIKGVRVLSPEALIAYSGLKVGDKIEVPGLSISSAIKKLWEQGILGDIQVQVARVEKRPEGEFIFLDFVLKEKPRLSKFQIKGLKKGEADDVREKMGLIRGKVLNDALLKAASNTVKKHFLEKGFFSTEVNVARSVTIVALF
jgi:outer membrane protein insertion porin family